MKFIVNSKVFFSAISSVSAAINKNNSTDIVKCFHFEINNGKLTMKATDLATTLVTTINVDEAPGDDMNAICIPATLMLDTLRNLDDAPLTFTADSSTYTVNITAGAGKYSFPGRSAETYPTLNQVENGGSFIIPASLLVKAINLTSFATSQDEDTHKQLSGIFCEAKPDGTNFVATDGHKLVRYNRKDITCDENTSFILPRKPLAIIKPLLTSSKEESDVKVEYNDTNVSFSFGDSYAICRLVDAKYPNYEAVIPRGCDKHMTIDRNSFLNGLRRVSLFANASTHQVRFEIKAGQLHMSSEDIEFANDASETMPCAYEGEPFVIGFNAKYLVEMVSALDAEQVQLDMVSPLKPGLLSPVDTTDETQKEDILMLCMPIALAD